MDRVTPGRLQFDPCRKCGEPDPDLKYAASSRLSCPMGSDHYGEHFHVICRRCGFTFAAPAPDVQLVAPTDAVEGIA